MINDHECASLDQWSDTNREKSYQHSAEKCHRKCLSKETVLRGWFNLNYYNWRYEGEYSMQRYVQM